MPATLQERCAGFLFGAARTQAERLSQLTQMKYKVHNLVTSRQNSRRKSAGNMFLQASPRCSLCAEVAGKWRIILFAGVTMPSKQSKHYEDNLRMIRIMSLMSDFFMTVCFEKNQKLAEMVLRIILKKPRLKIISADTQVSLINIPKRTVRFDVLAVDSSG